MTYNTLLLEIRDGGIAVLTINRPDKLNALNDEVITELGGFTDALARDDQVRAVVLTGAGAKAFVAGADIGELEAVDGAAGATFARKGQRVFRRLELSPKPVIAAVNGYALGGGCELAMACHFRLAAPKARFGQPEVTLGLIPGYGGTVRLPRLVGRGAALELLLTGRMIDAEEAARLGLVNRVVPAEELVSQAVTLAGTILAQGPLAVRTCLETVNRTADLDLDQALEVEAEHFGICCASPEKAEGTRAFLEKRTPNWGPR